MNIDNKTQYGSINITKALKINQQFELSKEFWAYCVKNNLLDTPKSFINPLPHLSFVADSNVAFLKDRFEALRQSPFYKNMLFSQDKDQIAQWVPLVMQDRDPNQSVAATFIDSGSDVNFGAIVTQLKNNLTKQDGIDIFLSHKVTDLNRSSKVWELQITDTKNDVKMLLKGSALMPDIAVIDPKFTLTAPPSVTANTGIDALTHAIEAFTSKKAQPLSDTFAISAIKKILNNLPKAYEDGHDIEARVNMSLAATEAGIAFNNSSVTLVHGMSRPIGALFHIAHGLSNAVLLIECIKFLSSDKASIARFAKLAKECAIVGETVDDHEAIAELIRVIESLYTKLKIPSLSSLIKEKDLFVTEIKKMTSDALQSGSPQNSLRDITEYDIENLYLKIISK